MIFHPRLALTLSRAAAPALALLLAACGGVTAPAVDTGPRPPRRPPPARLMPPPLRRSALPSAHVQSLPGLEGVIGSTATDLTRQFGTPRLDIREGDARKLQFSGSACVLDIYLYPLTPGREPQASYVDARRSDGRDVDRAACIAAMRRR